MQGSEAPCAHLGDLIASMHTHYRLLLDALIAFRHCAGSTHLPPPAACTSALADCSRRPGSPPSHQQPSLTPQIVSVRSGDALAQHSRLSAWRPPRKPYRSRRNRVRRTVARRATVAAAALHAQIIAHHPAAACGRQKAVFCALSAVMPVNGSFLPGDSPLRLADAMTHVWRASPGSRSDFKVGSASRCGVRTCTTP